MKKVNMPLIVRLCLPQFAVGLFMTMLNNYLIYFYQPSAGSGIHDLIPQGRIVLGFLTIIGLIKAIGHTTGRKLRPMVMEEFPRRFCKNHMFSRFQNLAGRFTANLYKVQTFFTVRDCSGKAIPVSNQVSSYL